MREDRNAKPLILQKTNVRRNLNLAPNENQSGSTRVVQVMELIIQTTFARIIPVLDHLIVFRYRKRNIIVFAIRDIGRMKMVNARKLSMNVKRVLVVQSMQIVLMLGVIMLRTVRDQRTTKTYSIKSSSHHSEKFGHVNFNYTSQTLKVRRGDASLNVLNYGKMSR